MGIFNFLNRKKDKNEKREIHDSLLKNIRTWTDSEKALLMSILVEIAWADDDFKASEKSSLSKSLFGAGVLNDIMEIQNLADKTYSKNDNEGDLEKIALDFKKLSPEKKIYIEKCIVDMVKVDGEIHPKEIAIAKQLTGICI